MSGLLHTGGGSMGFVDFVIAVKRRHVFGISLPCADHLGAALAQRLNKALYLFFVHLAAIILLTGCADKPVVVAVDTLCVSTSRPVITEAQRAAFRADQATWEPLVDWLAGFLKVRDGACLKPAAG